MNISKFDNDVSIPYDIVMPDESIIEDKNNITVLKSKHRQNSISRLREKLPQSNIKFLALLLIVLAIPITVGLALVSNDTRGRASNSREPMALGISLPYGRASQDQNVDAAIAEIEKFASPVSQGGVGKYPATYSIWVSFSDSWQYGSRNTFPSKKMLDYLDSKNITPIIFMEPVGSDMRRNSGTLDSARKYSNQSISDGSFDAFFAAFANEAKIYGKPIIVRYAHEMNGNWFPWSPYDANNNGKTYYNVGNTPQNYISGWRHVYNIMKPIAPNIMFFWCPNRGESTMAQYYPGNRYVDYVGFDAYNYYPNEANTLSNNTLPNIYRNSILELRRIVSGDATILSPKPIIIGETGLKVNNPEREAKLFNGFNNSYIQFPDLAGIIYFDLDVDYLFGANAEPGINWRLSGKSDNPNAGSTSNVDIRPQYAALVADAKFQGRLGNSSSPITSNPTSILTSAPSQVPTSAPIQVARLPFGYHDSASCTNITGWACDENDYNRSVTVKFYADAPAGEGIYLGNTIANVVRENAVGQECGGVSNHGFSFNLPETVKDGQSHQIYAYAVDDQDIVINTRLNTSPKVVSCTGVGPTTIPTPPDPASCVRALPTVSYKNTSLSGRKGGTVTYKIRIKNNDNSQCAARKLVFDLITPTARWSYSPEVVTLNPGVSKTVDFKVISGPYSSLGIKSLNLTIHGAYSPTTVFSTKTLQYTVIN